LNTIYLASQSPRRREILTAAGLRFNILPPDEGVEDNRVDDESPDQYACRMAVQKACNVAGKIEYGCVIACDTVVCCEGEMLGKPVDKNDARRMLKLLRGKTHQVISGLCILIKQTNKPDQQNITSEQTELVMQKISDSEIETYLDGNSWKGKAGAFGYQDNNSWVKILEGNESNVVGLPIERLILMLQQTTY
jgi:septum formation protein